MSREHDLTLQPRELVGAITISRPTGGGDDYVNIAIIDDLSGSEFVDLRISLRNFAVALTGQGYVPCVFEHRPDVVGMRAENKTELVPSPDDLPHERSERTERMLKQAEPFEVDGWKAREADLTNHHCHVRTKDGDFQRVTFFRHVKVSQ